MRVSCTRRRWSGALTPDKARDLLGRTKAARLLQGYRGGSPLDTAAVVDALVALGRIAQDLPDVIESIDIKAVSLALR